MMHGCAWHVVSKVLEHVGAAVGTMLPVTLL
jgi:hypothetical protein